VGAFAHLFERLEPLFIPENLALQKLIQRRDGERGVGHDAQIGMREALVIHGPAR
jgi:hypothetical protein